MRPQLMERRTWEEYADIPCTGDVDPSSWPIAAGNVAERLPSALGDLIAIDVVPSLVLAHRRSAEAIEKSRREANEVVEEFASLVLTQETPNLISYIEKLKIGGATIETVYLGLLSATARRLGEYWEEDKTDFVSVTIGLWRLQEVLRKFSTEFQAEGPKAAHGHRALLLSPEGEQHNFGLAILGEFLFRDGWSVAGGPGIGRAETGNLLQREMFSVVGLTLSCESRVDAMASIIRFVRSKSRNRGVVVMVGGSLFIRHPELVAAVGADATAPDARQAAIIAEGFINKIGSAT